MGGAGAFLGSADGFFGVLGVKHGHWRQAHDRPVAGGVRVVHLAVGRAGFLEMDQGRPDGVADAKAFSGAAQIPLSEPADIPPELVNRIKALKGDEAVRQAQGHSRVVRVLTRLEIEGAAVNHILDGFECSRRVEFLRGLPGVPHSQAHQAAEVTIPPLFFFFHYAFLK